jgi:hypothetical protein
MKGRSAPFLALLTLQASASIDDLFRSWKEREPKHSIVGIYAR